MLINVSDDQLYLKNVLATFFAGFISHTILAVAGNAEWFGVLIIWIITSAIMTTLLYKRAHYLRRSRMFAILGLFPPFSLLAALAFYWIDPLETSTGE